MDENLYSRQIAVYGKNAMNSLTDAKVIILGFDGSCLELCKNLILAGVGLINLVDSSLVNIEDLAVNYYVSEFDIGKIAVDVIKDKLSELNPYVSLIVNDMSEDDYDVYILINNSFENAKLLNEKVRSKNKKFIWLNTYGLMGNVFCDFGNFMSKDVGVCYDLWMVFVFWRFVVWNSWRGVGISVSWSIARGEPAFDEPYVTECR